MLVAGLVSFGFLVASAKLVFFPSTFSDRNGINSTVYINISKSCIDEHKSIEYNFCRTEYGTQWQLATALSPVSELKYADLLKSDDYNSEI